MNSFPNPGTSPGSSLPGPFVGQPTRAIPPPPVFDPQNPEHMAKQMTRLTESCYGKTVLSGVMGFGMGAVFGMFMASMAYDTPYLSPGSTTPTTSLPLRQQLKIGFKDMGSRSLSSAKNFGAIGALYSGIECGIEGLRAKNDLTNSVAAGCLTGGVLARNAGPQAVMMGCGGFAAFSLAIDMYMRQPSEE